MQAKFDKVDEEYFLASGKEYKTLVWNTTTFMSESNFLLKQNFNSQPFFSGNRKRVQRIVFFSISMVIPKWSQILFRLDIYCWIWWLYSSNASGQDFYIFLHDHWWVSSLITTDFSYTIFKEFQRSCWRLHYQQWHWDHISVKIIYFIRLDSFCCLALSS